MPLSTLIDNANNLAGVTPFGRLQVTTDPGVIFLDVFDGTVIDTNQWIVGGTVPPTLPAGGSLLVNPGTAASASSSLVSIPTIPSTTGTMIINVAAEAVTALGNHRFDGLGTPPGSWTAATPLQDAVGFEIDTAGVLRASVYNAGVRVFTQPYAVPKDGFPHNYFMYYEPGFVIFNSIDSENQVQASSFALPAFQALPVRLHSINGLATTTGTPTMSCSLVAYLDFSKLATSNCDGVYAWRRQTVGLRGDAVVSLMDGNKTTYSASVTNAAGVVGDTLVITGSATKTVRVTRIELTGTATAAADLDIQAIKRSTADTAGTGSSVALTPHDSNNAAATAVVTLYTAAPTPGTAVGTPVRVAKGFATTATAAPVPLIWDFGNGPKQGIVLRGVAQQLAINFSAALTGGAFNIDVELTEE